MKAMILAAGKGERMLRLTLDCPKPLLKAANKPLLGHWLDKLELIGVDEVIINTAYLGEQIKTYCLGRKGSLPITLSSEPEPLETGGALWHALSLLGEEPFLLINADVYCSFDLAAWVAQCKTKMLLERAHFLLVSNPEHNPEGDFSLTPDGFLMTPKLGVPTWTFAGISLMSPSLIRCYPHARKVFPLREVFSWALSRQLITGEIHTGYWLDVGTPERLQTLNDYLSELTNGSL